EASYCVGFLRSPAACEGYDVDELAIEPYDCRKAAAAQFLAGGCNRVEHRLHIGWRLADHAQDLARRGLLLECLGDIPIALLELCEQSHILDCDECLIGKGLQ